MNKGLRNTCVLIVLGGLIPFGIASATPSISLEVDVNLREQTLRGVEEVEFDAGCASAYFLVLANLEKERNPYLSDRGIDTRFPAGYEPASTIIEAVERVQSAGVTVLPFRLLGLPPALQTYSLEETILAVDLPKEALESVKLRIRFVTQIPHVATGDQGIDRGIFTWRFGWYPLLLAHQEAWEEVDGILLQRSSKSVPLEFAAMDTSALILIPRDHTLICGADRIEEVPADEPTGGAEDAVSSTAYQAWFDTPARTLALAAGSDYGRFALETLPIPIEVFFLPGHAEEARLFATYARDILEDYEERFGPYPRTRLTIAENPNRDGLSMAADGIVWLSALFLTHRNVTLPGVLNRLCEFILAHEIAHQWWGLGAGADLNAENWLSEGLAQYLAVSYFEDRYGTFGPNVFELIDKGILENLVQSGFGFINLREHEIELPYLQQAEQGFDEAIIKPLSDVDYENATQVRLYDKGYLVARAIAAAMGRETFERGLREAGLLYRHQLITVADLRTVLEEEADRSLEEFFDVWLFEPGSVDYAVEIGSRKRVEEGYHTIVKVSRDGGAIQPVTVEAELRSGETVRQEWDGATKVDTIAFETQEPVQRVTIDPDHLLPDRDRLNNNAPIKFVAVTNVNAYPLDAYVIRPNPFSRGVTLSYLDRLRLSIGEGTASAEVYRGRNHRFSFTAGVDTGDLIGSIEYTFTSFGQPESGSPGTYWEPDVSVSVSGHRTDTGEGVLLYGHLGLLKYPSIQHSRWMAIDLDLTPSVAGRIAITAFDEMRVFPQVYLQGEITLGASIGDLPRALLFDLDELISLGQMIQGNWVPVSSPGCYKLFGSLSVEFPANDDLYNLANLMIIDRVYGRAFVASGTCWTQFDELGKTLPYVEAGIESWFELSAIGGLLPIKLVVGLAVPIVGDGTNVIYFGGSL